MTIYPNNIEAEQALLGALLLDKTAIHRVTSMLEPSDFYLAKHGVLYDLMLEFGKEDKQADIVLLTERLQADDNLKMFKATELVELIESTPTAINVISYANIVAEKSRARKIIRMSDRAKDKIARGFSPDEVLSLMSQEMNNGAQSKGMLADNQEAITEALDNIDSLQRGDRIGYSFGISKLDRMLLGIRLGQFYIIAARPSKGKTTYGDQVLDEIEDPNAEILIEGRPAQILEKRIYRKAEMDQYDVIDGRIEWSEITRAAEYVSKTPTMLFKAKTLDEVVAAIYQAVSKSAKVIMIDYLQIIDDPSTRTQREKVLNIASALSELPGKLNIALILLAQLSRTHEAESREPELRDLQESAAIEQSADVVLFIYELKTKRKTDKGDIEPGTYILVRKNRFGKVGAVRVIFDKRRQKFLEYYGKVSG